MHGRLAAEIDKERAKVDAEIARRLADAEARIAQSKARAMAGVGEIAGDTAGAIVARLLGKEPSKDEVQRALMQRAAESGPAGWPMWRTAEFWVAVAFVAFLAILLYYKVPALLAKALDDRAAAIRTELDEARRLREEAQALLADYQRKHRNAGQEAEAIVEQARREAEAFASETRRTLAETLKRRSRHAEERIARAEAEAVDEVRAAAVDTAIAAAEKILREQAAGAAGAQLIDESIRNLKGRLN